MTISKRTSSSEKRGFLARLGRDRGGNVFAMTAAAVVPMIGVVGGAIDASRMYLTHSRLQSACDAAVLAGRKAMTTAQFTTTAETRADAMFNFNFQDADFGTTGTDFNAAADANGKLSGTAVTSIPMTLMKIFGFSNRSVSVACSADVQIPNIDIVFVLDVTGSMDDEINNVKKIASLKVAAKNFYTKLKQQLDAGGANSGQVRYGFVPYSQSVNGKELFKSSPDSTKGELAMTHLVDSAVVESRVANFALENGGGEWIDDPNSSPVEYSQKYDHTDNDTIEPYKSDDNGETIMSNNDCEQYSDNLSFSIDNNTDRRVYLFPLTAWPGDAGQGHSTLYSTGATAGTGTAQTAKPTTGSHYWQIKFERVSNTWEDKSGEKTDKYRSCTRKIIWTKFIKDVPDYKFVNWTYQPVTYDVSGFKTNTSVSFASAVSQNFNAAGVGPYTPVQLAASATTTGLTISSFQWNGCLEERDTVAVNSFTPIPSGALDLNHLVGGTSASTRWRPIMDKLTYNRGQSGNVTTATTVGSADHSCPSAPMRNLRPYATQADFDNYINLLQPVGYTYLDIGMIWGLRLIAPQGIFGSRNLTGPNGGQISRHIIFLTDGEPVSADSSTTSYGLEAVSKRITGTTGQSAASLHAKRFQALCDVQRGTVSIWAIAFGTSVTGNLTSCADPGRAYQADDAADLDTAFANIARDIADLRLVQ